MQQGQILYTPAASYAGADALTYTITGAGGATASSNVAITVTAGTGTVTGTPPVANPAATTVTTGQSVTVNVLALDAPGLTLTVVGTNAQCHGHHPEWNDPLHGADGLRRAGQLHLHSHGRERPDRAG